eukprot:TRINITY_DN9374_c0_g4_i2.p1 TRINITY_DN9374_c0_g4~~TRINITY_DN9374_c0_g4_i2.p1  ORF type:complete len:131 (-),score=11.17 TRINITY_DN9374_c0_g4_i2:485-877(-)
MSNLKTEDNTQPVVLPKQNIAVPLTLQVSNGINKAVDHKPLVLRNDDKPKKVAAEELPRTSPDDFINNLIQDFDNMANDTAPAATSQRIEKTTLGKVMEVVSWVTSIIACAYVFVACYVDYRPMLYIWVS